MQYPASIEVRTPDRIANWRPVVQWVLAIPHLVIAGALGYAARAIAVVSWFAIVFTGRLPAGLANFQIMAIRYSFRAQLYAGFLHDEFPPFEFSNTWDDPGSTPVTVRIMPSLTDRNRLTVGLRIIWLVPALLFGILVWIVGVLAWIGSWFAVLFTGRWPSGLRDWVLRSQRVSVRLQAYAYLLTDDYPPFATD